MAHTYRDLPAAWTTLQLEVGYSFVDVPGCTDISIDGFKRGVRTPTLLTSPAVVKKPGMPNFGTPGFLTTAGLVRSVGVRTPRLNPSIEMSVQPGTSTNE